MTPARAAAATPPRTSRAGKPVLNAEYTQDGETTAKFCPADTAAGIIGALFDVDLDGNTYTPCAPVGQTTSGGIGGGGGAAGGTSSGVGSVHDRGHQSGQQEGHQQEAQEAQGDTTKPPT